MTKIEKFGDNPIIGTLTYKKYKAQRKFDSQVVWGEIEASSVITNRDTIRTAELSDAIVTLKDGTKIELAENSMVYLDFSDKDINVNFAYGSISANKAGGDKNNLNIKSGDLAVQISTEGGDLKLTKTSEENVKLEMSKGEAKLISETGQEKVLKKDETLEVKSVSEKTKEPVKLESNPAPKETPPKKEEDDLDAMVDVRPLFPLTGETLNANDMDSIKFEWEKNPNVNSYLVELYSDSPMGRKSVFKEEVSSDFFVMEKIESLQSGNFSWSVTAIKNKRDGKKIYSVPAKNHFTLIAPSSAPPKIISPKKIYVD